MRTRCGDRRTGRRSSRTRAPPGAARRRARGSRPTEPGRPWVEANQRLAEPAKRSLSIGRGSVVNRARGRSPSSAGGLFIPARWPTERWRRVCRRRRGHDSFFDYFSVEGDVKPFLSHALGILGGMKDPDAELAVAIKEVAAEDRAGWAPAGLTDRVRGLWAMSEALQVEVIRAVAQWDQVEGWGLEGSVTAVSWLCHNLAVSRGDAIGLMR